jgi:hypothetical protein
MPGQPFRRKDKLHEVIIEFEAFLLDYMKPNDELWVHSTLKACTEAVDCLPVSSIRSSLGLSMQRRK